MANYLIGSKQVQKRFMPVGRLSIRRSQIYFSARFPNLSKKRNIFIKIFPLKCDNFFPFFLVQRSSFVFSISYEYKSFFYVQVSPRQQSQFLFFENISKLLYNNSVFKFFSYKASLNKLLFRENIYFFFFHITCGPSQDFPNSGDLLLDILGL